MTRLSDDEIRRATELWDQGWTLGAIAAEVGCSVYDLSPWIYHDQLRVIRDALVAVSDEERRQGMLARRELEDGRELVIVRMIFNDRLCVGPAGEGYYERAWCFRQGEAWSALRRWNGEGDPPGPWLKEAGTERRGPGATTREG